MATQTDNPSISIVAGATLVARRLVKSDGTYCAVSAARNHVGVTQDPAASGDEVGVRLPSAGTVKVTASVAITAGALLYYAADGKVGITATSNTAVGIALEAASGDGSIFEMLPIA